MDEKILRARIAELSEALAALPACQPAADAAGAYVPQPHCPPGDRTVDDMLDHLRLQMKYLTFDLEATRRENRYLRQMLERRTGLGDAGDTT